jgi:Glyceraldehyde 3-phosphate dehydrogenase, NAD binding domain/Glyceraldehyde 3-phosphate dehydrogenase, C-terminal domain
MPRIAIHGFGRIGRSLMRVALKDKLFVPVSISDIKDVPTLAALFEVDSNYGRWPEEVTAKDSCFVVGGREIPYFDSMKALPNWKALGVDLVIDCTGRASTRPGAQAHLDAGAKRVLISAPSKKREDCDAVLLPGINLDTFNPAQHKIVSMASCTTNALAPVVKVVIENFGIKYGLFSTIHAYTNSQALTDQPMKDRRARARVHLEGPQHLGQGLPRPHTHRQHRRAEPADRASSDRGSGQRRVPQGGQGCAPEGRDVRPRRRMGIVSHRRRSAFIDRRSAADRRPGRTAVRRRLV